LKFQNCCLQNQSSAGYTEAMSNSSSAIESAAAALARRTERLAFHGKAAFTYNPLVYAWAAHAQYIRRFAGSPREILFVGMNPGPWGMAQTGVPFGEIGFVRDWMRIEAPVRQPPRSHPKKPVEGFACRRSEVSGRRLWGLMKARFETPERFFSRHYVANYCPLIFMEEGGKNLTPDKLPKDEREALFAACDAHLMEIVQILRPHYVIGVGKFAEQRVRAALEKGETPGGKYSTAGQPVVGSILHPSPASPQANRGWAEQAGAQLVAIAAWPQE
jgi:single-strand selective monofunctional uracil DNA glycosylase